jgi:hypothetical protein
MAGRKDDWMSWEKERKEWEEAADLANVYASMFENAEYASTSEIEEIFGLRVCMKLAMVIVPIWRYAFDQDAYLMAEHSIRRELEVWPPKETP